VFEERLAIVAASKEELISKLDAFIDGRTDVADIFLGNARRAVENATLLESDDDAREMVLRWGEKGKWSKVAQLWSNGVKIDWSSFPQSEGRRRVPLPGYPFARERYWWPGRTEKLYDAPASQLAPASAQPPSHKGAQAPAPVSALTPTPAAARPATDSAAAAAPVDTRSLMERVLDDVRRVAGPLVKISPDRLDVQEGFGNYGFESIALKKLSDDLSLMYGVDILPTIFFEKGNIEALSRYLVENFEEEIRRCHAAAASTVPVALAAAAVEEVPRRRRPALRSRARIGPTPANRSRSSA
jgi:hypothetical protein